jgi:hypothetical protein
MKLFIARDKDGELYLYPSKPRKGDYRFACGYVYEDYSVEKVELAKRYEGYFELFPLRWIGF